MSDSQILSLISRMRAAQGRYFELKRTHPAETMDVVLALREARRLEEWVDLWLRRARAGEATLFPREESEACANCAYRAN